MTTPQITPESYFALVHHCGYDRKDSAEQAIDEARAQIQTNQYGTKEVDTRAFIELRVKDIMGDRPTQRWEVFIDGVEPMPTEDGPVRAAFEALSERRRTRERA